MADDALEQAGDVLEDVAVRVREVLSTREQVLRLDADPALWLALGEEARGSLAALVRFASAHAPRGCELLLAAARPAGRMAVAGAGRIVLRWQLALESPPGETPGNVVPLRAPARSPETLAASPEIARLAAGFAEGGFRLDFDVLSAGRELCATLSRSPA